MRGSFTALCRLLLRLFFRRIERIGAELVPSDVEAPVLYVLNHPNALLDPLFILCQSPRPVTFLAKAPLFSTFLVRRFVMAFECLPVYRKQDGADPSKNRASIEASIALLGSGKALALFPEGVSHSEPKLQPLKTGAARIALSASAPRPDGQTPRPVQIVPVGLHYADKATFRSDALIVYGPPLEAPSVALDERARPPHDAAEALTTRITEALGDVMIQAHTHEAVELARLAAKLLTVVAHDMQSPMPEASLGGVELERRLIAGYEALREREPERVDNLVERLRALEAQLHRAGVPVDQPLVLSRRRALRFGLSRLVSLLVLAAPASVGVLTHWLPYRAIDLLVHPIARRRSHHDEGEDLLASLKLIAGFLFFPLTWLAIAVAIGLTAPSARPWSLAGLALLAIPACGYAALRFLEIGAELSSRARAAWVLVRRRDLGESIASERLAIRDELLALAQLLDP